MKPKSAPKNNKRRNARVFAMQALFHWSFTNEETDVLVDEFLFEQDMKSDEVDIEYFKTLLVGTLTNIASIDKAFTEQLDRKIERLNPVELSIIRLGIFELTYQLEVPYAVVINEAIELAKAYGAADGHKYVNGVLNAVVKTLRPIETRS
jgi:N utilization substance protein B